MELTSFQPCSIELKSWVGGEVSVRGLISFQPYRFGDLGKGVITEGLTSICVI